MEFTRPHVITRNRDQYNKELNDNASKINIKRIKDFSLKTNSINQLKDSQYNSQQRASSSVNKWKSVKEIEKQAEMEKQAKMKIENIYNFPIMKTKPIKRIKFKRIKTINLDITYLKSVK